MNELYAKLIFDGKLAENLGIRQPISINLTAANWIEKRRLGRIISPSYLDECSNYEEIQLEHMPTMIALGLRELDIDKDTAHKLSEKKAWIVSNYVSPDSFRIVNYPRSGSTWLRLMLTYLYIWLWERGKKHAEALHEKNEVHELVKWAPYVVPHLYSKEARKNEGSPFPRFEPILYRTHRNTFTKRHPKVIYMLRDGRAATASFFELSARRRQPQSFDSISEFIERDLSIPGGGWWSHVQEWLINNKDHPNLLVVRYEDLKSQPFEVLDRVCVFLGLNAPEYAIRRATSATDIDRVRAVWHMKVENRFINSGETDSWKKTFTERDKEVFKKYGQIELEKLGYVKNDNW